MSEIFVMYGDREEDMVKTVLRELQLAEELHELNGGRPFIALKPNLVVPQPAEWGATTSPRLVRGVIEYLKENGFTRLAIMESSWTGDKTAEAFKSCGYQEISREYGVPLVDLKEDSYQQFTVEGLKISVCSQPLKADYLINMPVLKAHCQTKLTCALKNLKGCIPDAEKKRFHREGLHRPIAFLNSILRSNLTVVDGFVGDLSYEGGGTPVRMNRLIVGRDPVKIDAYAARLLGYDASDIEYLVLAERMGLGSTTLEAGEVVELNSSEDAALGEIPASTEVDYLQRWIADDQACSACYASLFFALKRLKEKRKLHLLQEKIHIGQGFLGKRQQGLGAGKCAAGFYHHLGGCPPDARATVDFLKNYLKY